jgi:endo-1,4-beta-xylanase
MKKKIVVVLLTLGLIFSIVPAGAAGHAGAIGNQPSWDLNLPTLAETFEEHFLVGNIWSSSWRGAMNANARAALAHHFNAVTAEDYMKVDQLLSSNVPGTWNWNWSRADEIVNFAEANDMAMIGHTLVWHSQSRLWLTGRPGAGLLTRQEAVANMRTYINTVAGRWAGRIYAWDVVNEVFTTSVSQSAWNANPDWRAHLRRDGVDLNNPNYSRWYDAFANGATGNQCGSDFIYYAFRFTRLADPNAILYYNDFNEEQPGKREAIAQMVEQLNQRWTRDPAYDGRLLVERIGMQGHYHLDQWATNLGNVRTAIERFARTGAGISITELDITIGGQGGNHPATLSAPLTAAQQQRQADAYARVFRYIMEFVDYIERVSFWGMADNRSWRAWGHPTLFDGNGTAKLAFHAVTAAAPQRAIGTPTPPAPPSLPLPPAPSDPLAVNVLINNSVVAFDGAGAQLQDGRTLVPVRGVFEELGFTVDWEQSTQTATLTSPTHTIVMRIGDAFFTTNGTRHNLDVPAQLIGGRTMVPFRLPVESAGFDVDFDQPTRTVIITG